LCEVGVKSVTARGIHVQLKSLACVTVELQTDRCGAIADIQFARFGANSATTSSHPDGVRNAYIAPIFWGLAFKVFRL
jgi:hypothetical protein